MIAENGHAGREGRQSSKSVLEATPASVEVDHSTQALSSCDRFQLTQSKAMLLKYVLQRRRMIWEDKWIRTINEFGCALNEHERRQRVSLQTARPKNDGSSCINSLCFSMERMIERIEEVELLANRINSVSDSYLEKMQESCLRKQTAAMRCREEVKNVHWLIYQPMPLQDPLPLDLAVRQLPKETRPYANQLLATTQSFRTLHAPQCGAIPKGVNESDVVPFVRDTWRVYMNVTEAMRRVQAPQVRMPENSDAGAQGNLQEDDLYG